MKSVPQDVFHKKASRHALTHQPPGHIREYGEDGIDVAAFDEPL